MSQDLEKQNLETFCILYLYKTYDDWINKFCLFKSSFGTLKIMREQTS